MANDPRLDPSTTSSGYEVMAPKWKKIRTLLSGTDALREKRQTYLPQFPKELDKYYEHRLANSTLLNMAEITLGSWVGRPFSDPVQTGEDVPEAIVDMTTDIDSRGNGLSVFLRDWFKEGLAFAHAHVLIDSPFSAEDTEGRTKADDLRDGARPFWSFLHPEDVIFMSSTYVGSQEILTHVRISETETEMDGFAETQKCRIRVFNRVLETAADGTEPGVYVSVWEKKRVKKTKRVEWIEEEPPKRIGIDEIPLVTFYADRTGIQMGKPPLEDLVDLNLAHWRSSSDHNNILTVTRFPIIAASGVTPEEAQNIVLAPRKVLASRQEKGKFYYLEHSGAAVKVGADDLAALEEKMAYYGADFLRKRPGNLTATARALDSAEATSPLQDAVNRFNEAIDAALRITGKWLGIEEPGMIEVASDFGPEELEGDDMATLREARKLRDLSRQKFLEELKRRGTLDDEFDFEENLRELEEEDGSFGGATLSDFGGEEDEDEKPAFPPAGDAEPQEDDDEGEDQE
jgi:hypothetical protein